MHKLDTANDSKKQAIIIISFIQREELSNIAACEISVRLGQIEAESICCVLNLLKYRVLLESTHTDISNAESKLPISHSFTYP